jgi:alkanesulfonate monooxygenase SsuD/methylene tetrahydromethanopterin reductase-like flavin-dependent oxidoreductase (luciferase family)
MTASKVQFGLTLPNRGVVTGATTVEEMLTLAEKAEATGWDSVWVGDSIFAKPRLDALVLLGALAARTKRVKLGPGCFASTPLRDALLLAYQWISLDFLSNGRTIFVSCQGAPGSGNFAEEFAAFRSLMKYSRHFAKCLFYCQLTGKEQYSCQHVLIMQ